MRKNVNFKKTYAEKLQEVSKNSRSLILNIYSLALVYLLLVNLISLCLLKLPKAIGEK